MPVANRLDRIIADIGETADYDDLLRLRSAVMAQMAHVAEEDAFLRLRHEIEEVIDSNDHRRGVEMYGRLRRRLKANPQDAEARTLQLRLLSGLFSIEPDSNKETP